MRLSFSSCIFGSLLYLSAASLLGCAETTPQPSAEEPETDNSSLAIDLMTFNIRYGTADDGPNAWDLRKDITAEVIRSRLPSIMGLQEAWLFQLDAIQEAVPGYSAVVRTREVDETQGEATPILYKEADWELDESDHGTFWLSDTPDVPGSRSWGNTLPRIATWARLIHRDSNQGIYVFNAHLDHVSEPARIQAAELLATRIAERRLAEPVFMMGDFNAAEDSSPLTILRNGEEELVDSFRVHLPDEPFVGTLHNFTGNRDGTKIDYILVQPNAQINDAAILYDNVDGRYPSDHFPVWTSVALPIEL